MLQRKLINIAAVAVALVLAVLGVVAIVATRAGAVQSDGNGGIVFGVGLLLVAAPLFALPFSRRVFRLLGVVDLLALAAGFVYLSFQPELPTTRPAIYQAGAVALAVLLVARVVLSFRARSSRQDV